MLCLVELALLAGVGVGAPAAVLEELTTPLAIERPGAMPAPKVITQGEPSVDAVAPHVHNYAVTHGFNPAWLGALFPSGYPQPAVHHGSIDIWSFVPPGSDEFYFRSRHALIYEILNVRDRDAARNFTVVLYSSVVPMPAMVGTGNDHSPWRLALFSGDRLVQLLNLPIRWDPEWLGGDGFVTALRVREGALKVLITTVVTGTMGDTPAGFEFSCAMKAGRLVLSATKRIEGDPESPAEPDEAP